MARLSTPVKAALVSAVYFVFSVAVVSSFNLGLPPLLERVLSMVAAPALLLLALWAPLLRPLGLATGEALAAPTLPGALLLIVLYAGLAYLATKLVLHLFRRKG